MLNLFLVHSSLTGFYWNLNLSNQYMIKATSSCTFILFIHRNNEQTSIYSLWWLLITSVSRRTRHARAFIFYQFWKYDVFTSSMWTQRVWLWPMWKTSWVTSSRIWRRLKTQPQFRVGSTCRLRKTWTPLVWTFTPAEPTRPRLRLSPTALTAVWQHPSQKVDNHTSRLPSSSILWN